MWLTSCWHIKRLTQKPFPSELKPSPSAASFLKYLSLTLSPMLTIFITLLAQELLTPTASSYMTPTLPTPSLWWCHNHDIPPQASHTYSCLLTVQTPPKHSLTKPKPIPGLPDPSIAFPKGCYTNICLVSIPKAVNTIPEHIQPFLMNLKHLESHQPTPSLHAHVTPVTTNHIQDRRFRPRAWSHSPRACYRSPRSLARHHYASPTSYSTGSRPHNPT